MPGFDAKMRTVITGQNGDEAEITVGYWLEYYGSHLVNLNPEMYLFLNHLIGLFKDAQVFD